MAINTNHVWAIAYINRKFIDIVDDELEMYGYEDIEAYIPTVKLLTKKFKNKNLFEFVPLLFNYGFFKIPYDKACNPDYLMTLRHRITAIYAWVKDPILMIESEANLRMDNEFHIHSPQTAIASDKEIANLIKSSRSMGIFNKEDIERIKPGDYIKLEGYPFDGMPAEIVKINHKKKEVKVKLLVESVMKEMVVSFDNVFYTVYKDFKEAQKEASTDEMKHRYGSNSMDHLIFNQNWDEQ